MAYPKQKVISKADMLARVVEPIREAMAAGNLPWLRPWTQGGGGLPLNPLRDSDNKDYTGGVNNLLLMIASMANGWSDPRWMGRGQVKKGGYSIKGLTKLKSTLIYIPVFGWRTVNEDGEEKRIKFATGFREGQVFNAEQIQDESFPALPKPDDTPLDTVTGYERAHAIYEAVGVHVVHGDDGAKYSPKRDRIYMPFEGAFDIIDAYHATRMHETGHATGHKSRLDRGLFGTGFGSQPYAYEELVAELFSAFACADAGIEKTELTANHASYLKSWHRRLGEKPEMFLNAVNDAWKALTWVRERMS